MSAAKERRKAAMTAKATPAPAPVVVEEEVVEAVEVEVDQEDTPRTFWGG
jgi:hypothetical protein